MALEVENKRIRQLLIKCKNNDSVAQCKIYKLYFKAMYNCAYRILRDSYLAEDIMQESFLIAFKKIVTIEIKTTFGAWLKKIVINKSLTKLKENKKFDLVSLDLIGNTNNSHNEAYHLNDVENFNKLKVEEIKLAMKKLKNNYYEILTLHLIEGYRHSELSEILNISNENCRDMAICCCFNVNIVRDI